MKYRCICRDIADTTVVPGEFIDEYMQKASGEYVKIYLFILRNSRRELDTEEIADALNVTEGDVERAMAYWERTEAILRMDIENRDMPKESFVKENAGISDDGHTQAVPAKTAVDMEKLRGNEEFSTLVYMAQKYLEKIFTPTDVESFAYMYDVLQIPVELIEYIVELSAQKGKKSVRYIEAVASGFHQKGIRTIAQAKEESLLYNGEVYSVMRSFGLGKREPGREELRYINKWFKEYGFTLDIILEACDRTIKNISKPSFRYTDTILTKWHEANVRFKSDIEAMDQQHNVRAQRSAEAKQAAPAVRNNNFHRFEQREGDMSAQTLQKLKQKLAEEGK